MTIHLGADHRGFQKKEKLKTFLKNQNFKVIDHGASQYDKQDNYPDYAFKVAENVAQEENSLGVLICGSGIGMAVAANKVKGSLASHVNTVELAKRAKKHNHLNILSLGADVLSLTEMKRIIESFLETQKDKAQRHDQRIEQIKQYELISNHTN